VSVTTEGWTKLRNEELRNITALQTIFSPQPLHNPLWVFILRHSIGL